MIPQLDSRLQGIREMLLAHHHAGAGSPTAVRGSEREAVVRDFLLRVFPAPFRFGTGSITDSTGAASGQLDVVVEWPFLASFPTVGSDARLYLAESAAVVLEVKSNLTKQWGEVKSAVSNVWPLRRKWRGHLAFEGGRLRLADNSESRIPYVAVGFEGDSDSAKLNERIQKSPESERPDAALVLESCAYVGQSGLLDGTPGLFAFCADMSYFVRNVILADPMLEGYLRV